MQKPIHFTDHAIERCREQDIPPTFLKDQLKNVPNIVGVIRWRVSSGHLVVIQERESYFVIITVIGRRKEKLNNKNKRRRGIL